MKQKTSSETRVGVHLLISLNIFYSEILIHNTCIYMI